MARSLRFIFGKNPGRVLSNSREERRRAEPAVAHALVLAVCVAVFAASLPLTAGLASAAELSKTAKADAKTAMRFYKEGNYEDAAKIFVRLSVAYPDMLVFVRNLGACYYYLRRYEPALSNLRDYEHRKKDMAPDDRAEVAGWIGEMERLRDQAALVSAPPATAAPTTAPVVAPEPIAVPVATPPTPTQPPAAPPPVAQIPTALPPVAQTPTAQPPDPAPTATAPAAAQPAQPVENAYPPQGQYVAPPQGAYPQAEYGGQPQPAYSPQEQYGAQPQPAYPSGQYGAQPEQPGYPTTQYFPAGGGHPPTYQPQGGSPPAGVATQPNPPPSSGGGRKAVAWILGLTGVAAVAAGAAFTALALNRFSSVQKKYDPAAEKQGKQFATAQWVCYGSGVALLTTAIIVGATGKSSSPAVALAPVFGPGVAGAMLNGSF
jgi:hypothetical protein